MRKILVTGANGQLGRCIKDAATKFPDFEFVFVSKEELDIENADSLRDFFRENDFSHCINTAAYTNVEKAESEEEKAFAINAKAVKNLASICKENDVITFLMERKSLPIWKQTRPIPSMFTELLS